MKFWLLLFILLAVVVIGLAGCQKIDDKALIEYKRTGGFAGLDEHLIIQSGGQAVLTQKGKRTEFMVERVQIGRLTAALDDADFTKLDKKYLPAQSGNDLFEYWITYKKHTVHTADTAVPEELMPVLEVLNEIIMQGSS